MLFTKDEIKTRWQTLRAKAVVNGAIPIEAELSLTMLIVGNAFLTKKQRSGEDYVGHPMAVATAYTRSKNKRIIGLLHDLIEDTDWTLDDLREVGFSERIVLAVDACTRREGPPHFAPGQREPYFDFVVRCGQGGDDAIDVKINDLHHNMDASRYRHINDSEKTHLKQMAYNISYHYLVDLKKFREDGVTHYNYPGTPIVDYIRSRAEFAGHPAMVNRLLDEFSSDTDRLDAPAPQRLSGPAPTLS